MRSVSLAVGERHELRLRGLGSAGYTWAIEIDGPEGVIEVRRRPPPPAPGATPGGPPPPAGSLPELIQLQARTPGRVTIRLALRRSWEDTEPLERDEVEITVTEASR